MLLKYNQPRPDLSQTPSEKVDPLKVMRALQQVRAVPPDQDAAPAAVK